MFCTNCGKEIGEGNRFCPYCGHEVTASENQNGYKSAGGGNGTSAIFMGLGPTDIFLGVLYIFVAVRWILFGTSSWKSVSLTFGLMENGSIGRLCYILVPIVMLLLCAWGIWEVFTHTYHVITGLAILVCTFLMVLGNWIFSGVTMSSTEIMAGRICSVYSATWGMTIVLSLIIVALCAAKKK